MKRLLAFSSAVAVSLLTLGVSVAEDKSVAGDKGTPSLETVKKLVGDWVELDKEGKPTANVVSSIRVTSGSSAVREILFPGTDHEMVTMYHQEASDLILTHYCVLGNQPRMRAERGTGPNKLVFKCVGGSNLKPEKDAHMGQGTIIIEDADHVRSEWVKCEDCKPCETHKFNLARKK
jgi:hypothetical protein